MNDIEKDVEDFINNRISINGSIRMSELMNTIIGMEKRKDFGEVYEQLISDLQKEICSNLKVISDPKS
jgi:type I restriction-modification system DNA methylase subunit